MRRALTIILLVACSMAWAADEVPKPMRVTIKGMQFSPATVTIKVGQTVIWANADDRDHTVVAADGSFKSGNLPAGASYSFTFSKKGKFAYGCSYHPRMKGVIMVTD